MSFCPGVNVNEFFENTSGTYYTAKYTGAPVGLNKLAKEKANYLTGYYSDKAPCNWVAGLQPGEWSNTGYWHSFCHGVGVKRELTNVDLFGNACGQNAAAFCDSITDQGGNKRRPQACGGPDPNVFTYNPTQIALDESKEIFDELSSESQGIANEIIKEQRKKIFSAGVIILILIIVSYLILKF